MLQLFLFAYQARCFVTYCNVKRRIRSSIYYYFLENKVYLLTTISGRTADIAINLCVVVSYIFGAKKYTSGKLRKRDYFTLPLFNIFR